MLLPIIIQIATCTQINYLPLEDIRSEIDVIPYTPEQRIQIATSMKNMFSMYVNRQSKIDNYLSEYPNIDPIPRVNKLLVDAAHMTDIDFHYKFVDIFMSIRDYHTNYYIPGAHGCIELQQAISFTIIEKSDKLKVVASKISADLYLRRYSPQALEVSIGDELISVDGISIKVYINNQKFITGGANEYGSIRATLSALSLIDCRFSKIPDLDHHIYEFSRSNNQRYKVKIPWVSIIEKECWKESKDARSLERRIQIENKNKVRQLVRKTSNESLIDQRFTSRNYTPIRMMAIKRKITFDENIDWTIHDPENKNLGIIFFRSFDNADIPPHETLEMIRELLLNELKETRAVVFDVRSNRGGTIFLAHNLPQLFSSQAIITGLVRSVVNQISRDIVNSVTIGIESVESKWILAYRRALSSDKFTPIIKISKDKFANRIGQAYAKPVGIFTNAECYSACELFVSHMKDNNVATIIGEDPQTGGGGAFVIGYSDFLHARRPDYFPLVPFQNEMPLLAQKFDVAWRQIVRIDGSTIEDSGVKSEYIVRPQLADIETQTESLGQFDTIADILFKKGETDGRNGLIFLVEPKSVMDVYKGQPASFDIESFGFTAVIVKDEFGRELLRVNLKNKKRMKIKIQYRIPHSSASIQMCNIVGLDNEGDVKFSTWRGVRTASAPRNNFILDLIEKYTGF